MAALNAHSISWFTKSLKVDIPTHVGSAGTAPRSGSQIQERQTKFAEARRRCWSSTYRIENSILWRFLTFSVHLYSTGAGDGVGDPGAALRCCGNRSGTPVSKPKSDCEAQKSRFKSPVFSKLQVQETVSEIQERHSKVAESRRRC